MKKLSIIALIILSLLFSGRLTAPFEPPLGVVSVVEAPLSIEYQCSGVAITDKE